MALRAGLFVVVGLGVACGGGAPSKSAADSAGPRSSHHQDRAADAHAASTERTDEPMSNAVVEARLRKTLAELPKNARVERIALADIAYPESAEENHALGGFAFMIVTALAQDPADLPLRRVHFHSTRGELDLPVLFERVGTVEPEDLRRAFGATRTDGLYAIPLGAAFLEGSVIANFKAAQGDFEILAFHGGSPPTNVEPIEPSEPDADALDAFVNREFPVARERELGSTR